MKRNLRKRYPSVILEILRPLRGLRMTIVYGFIFILCIFLTGCGPEWKKKFVRKRAEKKPEQVFTYEPKEYQGEPKDELYKRHFIFWKAWQEELIAKLGNNKFADIRAFEEALKSLDEMKDCLEEEKAGELKEYRKRLENFYTAYKRDDLALIRSRQMRQNLDRLMLKMDKAFRYSRVKEYIR